MSFYAMSAALGLAIVIALPSSAWAFRAKNHLEVNPITQTRFEVIQRAGAGASDFWCAAGDYARRVLGVAANQPVYLVAGRDTAQTRTNRIAVTFSLDAPPEAANFATKPLTLNLDAIGDSLRAAFAEQYCYGGLGDQRKLFP
ncbi:hypothetical protein [Aestuariivita sp.]|jgi:hypothetical protein|uniref:hypothetical protein n=1 Tax=Aestuariivita sp. TaxID=1872407 RepID=UPI0021703B59|nr:hypothetical protein [Aestuariivita sp.]MCE8009365.1 hypothetical protein [Aestuariivita sp.]